MRPDIILKKSFFAVLLLFCCSLVFAEPEFLEPDTIKETKDNSTVFEIKTNVTGAQVYLNNIFYGTTNLIIKDFVPGTYYLDIVKKGYAQKNYIIEVQKDFLQIYKIQLEEVLGTLCLKGIPENSEIIVDGFTVSAAIQSLVSESEGVEAEVVTQAANEDEIESKEIELAVEEAEVVEEAESLEEVISSEAEYDPLFNTVCNLVIRAGEHKIRVRCFGYRDFVTSLEIPVDGEVIQEVKLEKAPFELRDFKVSKSVFNPKYKNKIGCVAFSFVLTSSEPITFTICNEQGEVIVTENWTSFNNWYNTLLWDGRDDSGNILPDGEYVASIESRHYVFTQKVKIDSYLTYPLFDATKMGLGIGGFPSLFKELSDSDIVTKLLVPFIQVKPVTAMTGKNVASGFYAMETTSGIIYSFNNHFELNLNGSLYPACEDKISVVRGSVKYFDSISLSKNLSFGYGALIRYGLGTSDLFDTAVVDNGCGLGFGLLCGLDGRYLNFGLSSQFVYASDTGKFQRTEDSVVPALFVNGMTLSVKPTSMIRLNGWAGLNNLSSLQCGAGITFMPATTSVLISVDCENTTVFDTASYLSFGFQLSYLF